jgi:hypothetical protein
LSNVNRKGEYRERKKLHHSPRATLAAVGLKLQALQLLAPIREKLKIAQKKIKHEPLDKW